MYNTEFPKDLTLPSSARLLKSTLLALVSAGVVLVTCVLPAEYAIDPTGMGKVLGLTKMGEIKHSLATENISTQTNTQISTTQNTNDVIVQTTESTSTPVVSTDPVQAASANRKDSITIDLQPDQATEVKLSMVKGAAVRYEWTTIGGGLNYDTHGDTPDGAKDFYHGYGKGRNETRQDGSLTAAFDGKHGWYWRNRTNSPVQVVLNVEGQYSDIKKMF